MLHSVGIDIEDVSRFSSIAYDKKKLFYKKLFTDDEIKYCLSKSNPYTHFTARFCAKEATIKALKKKNISYQNIEIKICDGVPILYVKNKQYGIVSLSHTDKYAVACVIIDE